METTVQTESVRHALKLPCTVMGRKTSSRSRWNSSSVNATSTYLLRRRQYNLDLARPVRGLAIHVHQTRHQFPRVAFVAFCAITTASTCTSRRTCRVPHIVGRECHYAVDSLGQTFLGTTKSLSKMSNGKPTAHSTCVSTDLLVNETRDFTGIIERTRENA